MQVYRVTGPDGTVYEIDGPPGASKEEVIQAVKRRLTSESPKAAPGDDIYTGLGYQPDILDQVEEFFKGIPRGALGLLGTAATGAATLLPEEYELPTRDVIQSVTRSLQSPFAPDPGEEGLVSGTFGEALGSTVPLLVSSLFGPVGTGIAAATAAGAGAGEASERARAKEATEEERGLASLAGTVVGLSEMAPIRFIRNMGETAATTILNRLSRAAETGGVEGLQEAAATAAQNLISQNIYDPTQGTFTGTGEAFGYGAGVGALIQGLMDLVVPGKRRGPAAVDQGLTDEGLADEGPVGDVITPTPFDPELSPEEAAAARRRERQSGVLEREAQRQRARVDAIAEQRAFEATNRALNRQFGDAQADLFPADLIDALERPAPREEISDDLMAADQQRRDLEAETEADTIAQRESQIDIEEAVSANQEAERVRVAEEEQRLADDAELQRMEDEENAAAEAAIFQRDSVRQASDIETLGNQMVGEREQRYLSNRRSVLERVISSTDLSGADVNQVRNLYERSLGEQGFGRPQALPAEIATINRAVDVANASRPAPEVIPEDPLAAQNEALEAAIPERREDTTPSQPTLPGVEGRQGAERRGLRAPQRLDLDEAVTEAFAEPVTTIDSTFMDRMGIAPGATFRQMLAGRDMRNPEDRDYVRNQVERFIPKLPKKSPTVGRLNNFLRNIDGMTYGDTVQGEMFGPRGGVNRQRARGTTNERDGDGTTAEPAGTGRGDAATAQRRDMPDAPVADQPTRQPEEPRDDGLADNQLDDAAAGVGDAGVGGALAPAPKKAEPKKAEPKKAEPKKAEPKAEPKKATTASTAKSRAKSNEALQNEDGEKVTALMQSPQRAREDAPSKHARTYFIGDKGNIEAALRRMVFDDVNNLSQKAADKETNPVIKEMLKGTSGANARSAIAWVRENLGPKANKLLDDFVEPAENIKRLNNPAAIKAMQEDIDKATLTARRQAETKKQLAEAPKKTSAGEGSGNIEARLRKKKLSQIFGDEQLANDMLDALEDSMEISGTDAVGTTLSLEADGMLPFALPVNPIVESRLDAGDVKGALESIALGGDLATSKIARKLAENIGDTKIEFVEGDTIDGRAGLYNPKTNTIILNNDVVITNHTLMHEASHAVTQATLRNKSHPLTRQVTSLFEQVKGRMEEMGQYGAKNIDEFVSEYFSNPLFRRELATMFDKKSDMSVFERLSNIIGNFLRRMFGAVPKFTQESIDDLMMGLMSPSLSSRNNLEIYYAPETVGEYFNNNLRVQQDVSNSKEALVEASKEMASSGWKQTKKAVLGALSVSAVVDLGKAYLPKSMSNFQDLLNRYEGEIRAVNQSLGTGAIKDLDVWLKSNPEKYGDLQRVLFDGSLAEIDFRKGRDAYKGNKEKLAAYDALLPKWENLKGEGQKTYNRIRVTYDRLYKDLVDQIKGDVKALGGTDQLATALRNEFYKKLISEGGLEGYFPFTREQGDYFLQYSYVDPKYGTQDVTQIFETESERNRFMVQLRASDVELVKNTLRTKERIEKAMFEQYPTSSFLGGVMQILNANNADSNITEQIMRMAIEVSPQTSLARMMQRRKGDLGFDENVLKVFRNSTIKLSHRSAQIKFNSELGKLSRELDEEAEPIIQAGGEKGKGAKLYRSELVDRIKIARNPSMPWAVNLAKSVTYGYTLGFNPSSALIDMAAIPMVLYPTLKGMHPKAKVASTINNAMKLYMGSPNKHSVESYTTKGLEGAELQKVLKELGLKERDVKDVGAVKSILNYDFDSKDTPPNIKKYSVLAQVIREQGQEQRFSTLFDLESIGEGQFLAKGNAYMGFMMKVSENLRREITQVSAYDLAIQKMEDGGRTIDKDARREAALEAVRLSELTNGSTSALSGPRYAQTALGALPFMYKRYGISMMYLQFSQLNKVLRSETDPAVRREAFRQFGFTMGMSAIFAGARGMPFMGAAALLYNMFKDDDDDDFDTMLRIRIGTLGTEGIINHFAGINVAKRIAMTDMMFRSDPGNQDRTPAEILWTQLAGPTGGTINRVYRGVEQISDGNFLRGTESLLPAAIANLMKAVRYTYEGARTTKGDVILDDIGPIGIIGQGLGFAPAEYARRQEFITLRKRDERNVQERRSKLFDRYWMARKQGDFEGMQDVMEDIADFNKGVADPKKKILAENLKRSTTSREARDLKRVFGIVPGNYQQWRSKAIEVLGEDALD